MSRDQLIDVLVLGDPASLHGLIAGARAVDPAHVTTRFDSGTDTWTVTTADGEQLKARVLIGTAGSPDGVVARHGIPNRFQVPGPHTRRQARYVARLLDTMRRSGASRIESRAARLRVHRLLPTRGPARFYLTGSVSADAEIYDGPAVLTHGGADYPTRVRLSGHFDPIDGQYHWQGMFYADIPGTSVTGSPVSIRIGEHAAQGRICERTPWGTLTVLGAAGFPPFLLEDVEIATAPQR
ncbi:hypothetical protein AWC02_12830 [Mycolicibacter engbaekii]|uniref:DUF4873 domain-containing protein n=1 Tax=Mycolicibacter engbaekii TaxID=188915 RepID=A0A1X1TMQ4_9MYCO|nr:DUF4873 domain-containing protein [Mycolicibacter engbaekii]ORV45813.1 hypothetical protein AWC02_12830 [Mycolicibacter engbaekii]